MRACGSVKRRSYFSMITAGQVFEIWRSMNQPSMNAKKDRPDFVLQAWTMCAVAAGVEVGPPKITLILYWIWSGLALANN